jgi:oligosaccharide repeat unit polymerase
MLFLLISTISIFAVVLGRVMMGRWLNHLSLYSAGFGLSLSAYATGLIEYHPISTESWVVICAAAFSLFLGSAAVLFTSQPTDSKPCPAQSSARLTLIIALLSTLSLISLVLQAHEIAKEFGGLFIGIIENSNRIYSMRMRGALAGEPYLLFFSYSATALAGAYTAARGRLTVTALFPVVVSGLSGLLSMQRTGFVISVVLFIFSLTFAPRPRGFQISRGLAVTAVVITIVTGAAFLLVGSQRGMYRTFQGQTPALTEIGKHWADFPAHFIYISSPGPTLTQYLEHPELAPKGLFASYTLQSVYRLLSKVGFETNVPYYPPFVHSPVEANQGTYLAYIYSDFGGIGVVLVPFFVGAFVTVLARRIDRSPRLAEVMLYAHLMLCVTFAFAWNIVSATFFLASMVISIGAGMYLDRFPRKSDVESVGIALA